MMKKSNKKGFTLVELIVVIAIMAILAAVLVPTVTSKIKDANVSAALSDMNAIASSIQADLITLESGSTNTTYLASKTTLKDTITNGVIGNCTVTCDTTNGTWTITHNKYPSDVTTATVKADGTITNAVKA